MTEDVRHVGVYTAAVKVHPEVLAEVKVRVEPEGGMPVEPEAPAQPAPEPAPIEEPEASDDDFESDED